MPRQTRLTKIRQLQEARKGTAIISYVTSTRPGHEFQMAMDSIRFVHDHLKKLGCNQKVSKVDLFIHSNGGDGVVPWRLVTLIREYCKTFEVLVPQRAFSAATLTALGADKIVMHPMAMLGPTDPVVGNDFNPQDPAIPNRRLGISVEDVSAFIEFVKKDFGLTQQDQVVEALRVLAEKVHPLALGNVKRFHSQSRMMARKLLELHMRKSASEQKINKIVTNLTSELYFHGHPINRVEALRDIGLKVEYPDAEVERLMWELYLEYEQDMLLNQAFDPAIEFCSVHPNLPMRPTIAQAIAQAPGALNPGTPVSEYVRLDLPKMNAVYIESAAHANVFTVNYALTGVRLLNGTTQVSTSILRRGWELEVGDEEEAQVRSIQQESPSGTEAVGTDAK